MRYLSHKEPLVIKARKQNEYHDRFNEKVFYSNQNPHTTATNRLLHLSKMIKFMFLICLVVGLFYGYGYVKELAKTDGKLNKGYTANEINVESKDKDKDEGKDKKKDYENINDVNVAPDQK